LTIRKADSLIPRHKFGPDLLATNCMAKLVIFHIILI